MRILAFSWIVLPILLKSEKKHLLHIFMMPFPLFISTGSFQLRFLNYQVYFAYRELFILLKVLVTKKEKKKSTTEAEVIFGCSVSQNVGVFLGSPCALTSCYKWRWQFWRRAFSANFGDGFSRSWADKRERKATRRVSLCQQETAGQPRRQKFSAGFDRMQKKIVKREFIFFFLERGIKTPDGTSGGQVLVAAKMHADAKLLRLCLVVK